MNSELRAAIEQAHTDFCSSDDKEIVNEATGLLVNGSLILLAEIDRLNAALAAAQQRAEQAELQTEQSWQGQQAALNLLDEVRADLEERHAAWVQATGERDAALTRAEAAEQDRNRYYAEWNAREARIERLEQACYKRAKQTETAERKMAALRKAGIRVMELMNGLDDPMGEYVEPDPGTRCWVRDSEMKETHRVMGDALRATAPPEPAADPLAFRAALGAIIPTADLRPPEEIVRDLRDGKLPKPAVQEEE